MFMLCWAWLAFNCGSTYGINGKLWKICAKVAVTTLNGGIGGGLIGLFLSGTIKKGKYDICWIINSVLGGLVGVTASCSVIDPLWALFLGMFCGFCAVLLTPFLERIHLDDPVGAIPVHCLCGFIATVAVGVIGKNDELDQLKGMNGLIWGGGFQLLGVQMLGIVCIGGWAAISTFGTLYVIDKTLGLRVSLEEEILGADLVEHEFKTEDLAHRIELAWRNHISRPELERVIWRIYTDMSHNRLLEDHLKQYTASLTPNYEYFNAIHTADTPATEYTTAAPGTVHELPATVHEAPRAVELLSDKLSTFGQRLSHQLQRIGLYRRQRVSNQVQSRPTTAPRRRSWEIGRPEHGAIEGTDSSIVANGVYVFSSRPTTATQHVVAVQNHMSPPVSATVPAHPIPVIEELEDDARHGIPPLNVEALVERGHEHHLHQA